MFDDLDADTESIDVEKRAREFRQQHPDAPPEAVEMAVRAKALEERVDALLKQRRRREEAMEKLREELETRVAEQAERINELAKRTAGTQQVGGGEATGDDHESGDAEALRLEREVFTR